MLASETITPPSIKELVTATRETYAGPLEVGEDLVSFHIGDELTCGAGLALQEVNEGIPVNS